MKEVKCYFCVVPDTVGRRVFGKVFFTLFLFCAVPILERKLFPKSGVVRMMMMMMMVRRPTMITHNGEVTHEQQCAITDTNGLCFFLNAGIRTMIVGTLRTMSVNGQCPEEKDYHSQKFNYMNVIAGKIISRMNINIQIRSMNKQCLNSHMQQNMSDHRK